MWGLGFRVWFVCLGFGGWDGFWFKLQGFCFRAFGV